MNADKPVITRFLTASRRDLFTLTADLLTMVDEKVYQDAARPLVLGVGGTMSCGKKIITDAAVNHLYDRPAYDTDEDSSIKPPEMIGVKGHDEYWFGTRQGRTFEIDYIDAAWPNRRAYSRRLMYGSNDMDEKLSDFMALRHYGGLTVVQNPGATITPGINIYIERNIPGCTIGYEEARTLSAPLYLTRHFNKIARHNEWARYVEIEIHDDRLRHDDRFLDKFAAYQPFCRTDNKAPRSLREKVRDIFFIKRDPDPPTPVAPPVFGRNFPLGRDLQI